MVADTFTPPVDSGPQPLTVKVLLPTGAPESGVLVVFQDATGAVLSTATTDATGAVSKLVTAGNQVTIALGTASAPNAVTVQSVEPGDAITVVDTSSSSSQGPGVPVSVTLPTPTWDASGVSEYVYAGGCETSAGSELYLDQYCIANGQFPLFALAQQGGTEVAYTYQPANATVPDGGLPDGADTLPVAITRPWSTSPGTFNVTSAALPAGLSGVQFNYGEFSGGVEMDLSPTADETDDAGIRTSSFAIHPGFPDFVQLEAYARAGNANEDSIVAAATRITAPAAPAATSFDFSALPAFTAANIDSTDAGTPTQPSVTWTSAGSLAGAAGIVASFQWGFNPDDGGPSVNGTWTIVTPSSATSVQVPAMPSAGASWVPFASGYINPPRVVAMKGSLVPSYTVLKSQFGGLSLFPGNTWDATLPALPANGTLVVSAIFPDEG